jgi:hypothetical protein
VHQRAGLVQVDEVEGDPELHGRQRQAALEDHAPRIERGDLLATPAVVARGLELVDDAVDDVVADDLPVRRRVPRLGAVEVGAPHVERVLAEAAGDGVEDVLHGDRALRAAEAAEGGVALRVRLPRVAVDGDVRQPVGVVEVADGARHHRP